MARGRIVAVDDSGRRFTVGVLDGSTFRKTFEWRQAWRVRGNAIGIDEEVFQVLEEHGVREIRLRERTTGEEFSIDLEDWRTWGKRMYSPASGNWKIYLSERQLRWLDTNRKTAASEASGQQQEKRELAR